MLTGLLTPPLPEELKTAVSLLVAFVLATLIGAERQYRQRTAGLRTAVLVAVGASAFVNLGIRLTGPDRGVKTVAYVISGIGFLGAGVIMKEGMNVRGLNTAATLWCSASVGAFAGADLQLEACLVTGAVLACNTLLRPLVNAIDRAPLREDQTEATYEVQVTTAPSEAGPAQDLLVERLEAASYPVSNLVIEERGGNAINVVATLMASTVNAGELDAVIAELSRAPGIRHATWAIQNSD
ncbi:methyltransferase [Methylobacterium fujisawaense]|uniref:MgtC/SapB family protein n=1 Tax=Methylobacterium fujisawaense TaxID=107400 RepID=UPI002F304B49